MMINDFRLQKCEKSLQSQFAVLQFDNRTIKKGINWQ